MSFWCFDLVNGWIKQFFSSVADTKRNQTNTLADQVFKVFIVLPDVLCTLLLTLTLLVRYDSLNYNNCPLLLHLAN